MPGTGDTYHFGNVHGPVNAGSGRQFVAGRDQTVYEGDGERRELVAQVAALREALDGMRLTAGERGAADRELGAVREALDRDEPDREAAAGHLQRFTDGLRRAGALASAGAAAVGALSTLAHWLGPLGAGVLGLL
ncbi:hypothetical protein [Streptomyces sp. MBT33]|uniref:hypothetical protein n=1 Tax=Streptomyces sp. MBT33 TaxID=1488363 RepID=UPI00190D5FD0|nr:hypothetical protein [Streptomyces sp. MBT33]MBK3639230.1 hypothetical protein [Streptomyces sp. MBT33]